MRFRAIVARVAAGLVAGAGVTAAGGCVYVYVSSLLNEEKASAGLPLLEEPPSRAEQIKSIWNRKSSDVLVIGSDAVAASTALDCALRGYDVILACEGDLGTNATAVGSNIVDGGFQHFRRAYQQRDLGHLGLLIDSFRERNILRNRVPHLADSRPVLVPCYSYGEVVRNWLKMKAMDLVAASCRSGIGGSRFVNALECSRLYPTLSSKTSDGQSLRGVLLRYDVVADEPRVVLSLGLTAALFGANVVNHVKVSKLSRDEEGKVTGAYIVDNETGKESHVSTKFVVMTNCPSEERRHELVELGEESPQVASAESPSAVALSYYSPPGCSMVLPASEDTAAIAVSNFRNMTTVEGAVRRVLPDEGEEPIVDKTDAIIEAVSRVLTADIRQQDVRSSWRSTNSHLVESSVGKRKQQLLSPGFEIVTKDNLFMSFGGSWMLSRMIAKELVDSIHRMESKESSDDDRLCRTSSLKLIGSDEWDPAHFAFILRSHGKVRIPRVERSLVRMEDVEMDLETAQHLSSTYGDRAFRVAQIASQGFGKRIIKSSPILEAELIYSLKREMTTTALDFLTRRTRLAYLSPNECLEALPHIIDIMAEQVNWNRRRKEHELKETSAVLKSLQPVFEEIN